MCDPETGQASTSIGTDEYIKPEAIFLDIETLRDITAVEFGYVLGNILRSTRYGAVSSRIGKVKNVLTSVIFSDCELFSNLELTQAVYDRLSNGAKEPDFPLRLENVTEAVRTTVSKLSKRVVGQLTPLSTEGVNALIEEMTALYNNPQQVKTMLQTATKLYGPQA
jgi:CRISPR-associated protein Csc2